MIRRPPRSTLFPTRRSSDLPARPTFWPTAPNKAICRSRVRPARAICRSEEHTSELQSLAYLVCRLLLEKKKKMHTKQNERFKVLTTSTYLTKRGGARNDAKT